MAIETALEIRRVTSVRRRGYVTLRGISFQADSMSITCLAGHGRQGQHEALRAIAGLTELKRGSILLEGVPIQKKPPTLRSVRMVFPNMVYDSGLSVAESLAASIGHQSVNRVLAQTQLTDRADSQIDSLSVAERFMLHIAGLLGSRPAVLLFEDAFSLYDTESRKHILYRLRRLNWLTDSIMLVADSDMDVVRLLADETFVFCKGRLVSD